MFSIEDREMMERIRNFFIRNGVLPEYHEPTNTILLTIAGDIEPHPVLIGYYEDTLRILITRGIAVANSSQILLKHLLSINRLLPLGSFYYSTDTDDFGYSACIPIQGMPSKEFLVRILSRVKRILDMFIPEILSYSGMLYNSKNGDKNPMLH